MIDPKSRLWVGLFMAMVFVCGLSVGLIVSPWLPVRPGLGRVTAPPRPGPPPDRETFIAQRILDRLEEDPQFTDEQRERLVALFADRQQRFRQFNRDMRQRFDTERSRLRDDIATILTPDQMRIFDAARRPERRWRGERPRPRPDERTR